MEYLNDYNENALLSKLNLFSKCMSFIFMKMWTQMWIRRCSDIDYIMHMCWRLLCSISMMLKQIIYWNQKIIWYKSIISKNIKASLTSYQWRWIHCGTQFSQKGVTGSPGKRSHMLKSFSSLLYSTTTRFDTIVL